MYTVVGIPEGNASRLEEHKTALTPSYPADRQIDRPSRDNRRQRDLAHACARRRRAWYGGTQHLLQ